MRTRRETRRFIPTVDGLPLRIAPTIFAPTADAPPYTDVSTTPDDPSTGTATTDYMQPTDTSCV